MTPTSIAELESESTVAAEGGAPAPAGPGTLLRRARELRGITLDDVGASLKMSPRQIEAVENEDYSRLAGATFIRGFIRNYAKLLKIDPAEPLAALEARTAMPMAELSVPSGSGIRMPSVYDREGKGSQFALALVVLLLVIALVLYFDLIDVSGVFDGKPDESKAAAVAVTAQPEVVQPSTETLPNPASIPDVTQPAASGNQPAEPSEPAALRPGERRLAFSFDGESWVEVKDATGLTLISQLNIKGSTQNVVGRAPFQVVVGNAASVRLQYDDQMIDLRPHTRVEVARLSLE